MHKFWGVINSLTPQNVKPNYSSTIIVGNSIITTPAEIADEFNKHFCSIGKKLSDEANSTSPPDLNSSFLIKFALQCFYVKQLFLKFFI